MIRDSVPLAPYTTIGLGGPARHFCTCATADDVRAALEFARRHALPIHILGGGSNVVFGIGIRNRNRNRNFNRPSPSTAG
jgi:UDP-N-acetylmuramate dehydrogenase